MKKLPETLEIEFAKPGDEEAIASLIAALAEYEKAPKDNLSTPEKVRKQLFGPKPAAEVLMARLDGKVVGFALFFQNFSTWLCRPGMFLEDLFVLPEARGSGVAKALLSRLAAICLERDYGRFEWSCLEWNELAKGFYRRIGAKPMEEWRTWRMSGDTIRELAELAPLAPPVPKKPPVKKITATTKTTVAPRGTKGVSVAEDEEKSDEKVLIYTDGGCRPNPGMGAWAALLISGEKVKELVGGEAVTTNNRMEMLAAISALEALKRPCKVELHTDSEYLKNGINNWIHGWKKKNWIKKDGKPVLNVDLWKRLDEAIRRHEVEWKWVRGHAGQQHNERCDVLCTMEIDRMGREKKKS